MPDFHPLSLACVASLALLLFSLGAAVSAARLKQKVLIGVSDDPDAPLNRLVRTHGNTAEYAPMLALLILLLGALSPSPPVLVATVLVTACRWLFAIGMLTARTLSRPNPLRFVGAAGTYAGGIALTVMLAQALLR